MIFLYFHTLDSKLEWNIFESFILLEGFVPDPRVENSAMGTQKGNYFYDILVLESVDPYGYILVPEHFGYLVLNKNFLIFIMRHLYSDEW